MKSLKTFVIYLIERVILTWQFIVILLMIFTLPTLIRLIKHSEKIQVGDFQITVRELARSSGISNDQIRDLNGLTYDELKIFLIKGGEDANYYDFEDNSTDRDKFIKTFRNLDTKGLVKITKFDSTKIENNRYKYSFYTNTTEKGEKIHRAILDAIYQNFVTARIEEDGNK